MISFESVGDYPNGYSISAAEFQALSEIMDEDEGYYDYDVTEARETSGLRFMVVEKRCPKYEYTQTYYRVDTDGSWGTLYEVPPEPTYPEHEKLATVATEVQAVLEFINEGLDRDREPIPDELVYAHWGVDYEKIIEERKQKEEQP